MNSSIPMLIVCRSVVTSSPSTIAPGVAHRRLPHTFAFLYVVSYELGSSKIPVSIMFARRAPTFL